MSELPHLVKVQYGDFREAVERFAEGGPEYYGAQRFSVGFDESLAKSCRFTIVALPAGPYDVELPNGIRAIGMGWGKRPNHIALLRLLQRLRPTHLIVATPVIPVLLWGLARCKHVLPLFADSFSRGSVRENVANAALAAILNHPKFEFVANHNFPASRDLVRLGVAPAKTLPWDWPAQATPATNPAKEKPAVADEFRVFYVGYVSESKGVGDLIDAIALLRAQQHNVRVTIAGNGDVDEMLRRAEARGVSEYVEFLGRVSHSRVPELMRDHDAVAVPSRSTYPEGLPLTIYEAFCSRTPLVVSNHPMFTSALGQQQGALMFKEQNPESLADALKALMTEPTLYHKLSVDSEAAWKSIQVPLKIDELVTRWLDGSPENTAALKRYSLEALGRVN